MDNAATSWRKPPEVIAAMQNFLERAGGNPGRSGHRLSVESGRIVYDTREAVAEFFNTPDQMRVLFTQNATYALNTAIFGLLEPGDCVVTTSIEHNSVMRPLRYLEQRGLKLTIVECEADASLDINKMETAITPETKMVIANFASNVTGTILPIADIAELAHNAGAMFLVDAAQAAGIIPIDVSAMGIDMLAFTGHKGLLGPTGTGGLVVSDSIDICQMRPLVYGGTGSRSDSETQPSDLPDKFESGTPNALGIAGLKAGLDYVTAKGVEAIREKEIKLTTRLIVGLNSIAGITVYGPDDPTKMTAVVSFTASNRSVSEIGYHLDEDYSIMSRVGLHCSPAAHKTIGTFPNGTVRLAPGPDVSLDDIDYTINAIARIVG